MFDHRLGLALGKSLDEIRAMNVDEWLSWKDFYALEPWGWQDREYRTAMTMAFFHNVYKKKNSPVARVGDYIRDMTAGIENMIARKKQERDFFKMTREEKKNIIRREVRSWGRNK
jgi:hypothetical protein